MSYPHPHLPLLLTLCNPTGSAKGRGVGVGWAVLPVTSPPTPCPAIPLETGFSLGPSVFPDSFRAGGSCNKSQGKPVGDYEVPGWRVCPDLCETSPCVHPRLARWAHTDPCRGRARPPTADTPQAPQKRPEALTKEEFSFPLPASPSAVLNPCPRHEWSRSWPVASTVWTGGNRDVRPGGGGSSGVVKTEH